MGHIEHRELPPSQDRKEFPYVGFTYMTMTPKKIAWGNWENVSDYPTGDEIRAVFDRLRDEMVDTLIKVGHIKDA